jgi:hypothetical protein
LTVKGILWAFTNLEQGANWHPLTWISRQSDVALFRPDPRGHLMASLLFCLAFTSLLFVLLRRST